MCDRVKKGGGEGFRERESEREREIRIIGVSGGVLYRISLSQNRTYLKTSIYMWIVDTPISKERKRQQGHRMWIQKRQYRKRERERERAGAYNMNTETPTSKERERERENGGIECGYRNTNNVDI